MLQLRPVPYHPQIADGYCLAACVQMVLPAAPPAPIAVSIDEFMLAWGEMDYHYALISLSGVKGAE
jgi:ABC-type glycerol-3-phosphate transport system permease component